MKHLPLAFSSLVLLATSVGCNSGNVNPIAENNSSVSSDSIGITNTVIETILSRRSIRNYLPQPVGRDTMEVIVKCGINAPSGLNRQPWEVRVIDDPEFIRSATKLYVEENPEALADSKMRNMFRNAPTIVFIAAENNSQLDCGLLTENMLLSAWSMGIGSCCLGGPARFMKTEKASELLRRLEFSEGYELVLAIGFGYPAESPEARPRDLSKSRFL